MDKKQVRYYIISEEEVRKRPRINDYWLFGRQSFTEGMLRDCGKEITERDYERILADDIHGGGYGISIFGIYNTNLAMIEVRTVRRKRGRIKIRE